ncbi:MAG: hypothetical protein H0W70_09175, partial [Actinobacteria bacterium]|nr:hypothetical protein [Actinomycetota bacterium]
MPESLLNVLKLLLLALVYLFFFRVLRAMWVQVNAPAAASGAGAPGGAAEATARAG